MELLRAFVSKEGTAACSHSAISRVQADSKRQDRAQATKPPSCLCATADFECQPTPTVAKCHVSSGMTTADVDFRHPWLRTESKQRLYSAKSWYGKLNNEDSRLCVSATTPTLPCVCRSKSLALCLFDFSNGDQWSKAQQLVFSPQGITFTMLLDRLTARVRPDFGAVHRIYTLEGKRVSSMDVLEQGKIGQFLALCV